MGSSAGAMLSVFLASGLTSQEIINGILGLKKGEMRKLSYKDMFHLHRPSLNPLYKTGHGILEEFPRPLRAILSAR